MKPGYEKIIGPIESAVFYGSYWEQQPLHIARGKSAHFADLIDVRDIEMLFSTHEVYFPSVQVVKHGEAISVSSYTGENRKILPHRLMQHHLDGATVIISQSHKKFTMLGNLCRDVTSAFQMKCQANLYLSPAGCQGFDSHYDTHDVFILQVSGSKTFRFYQSDIELPFVDDTFRPQENGYGVVEDEITLAAGDTLFIPRGVVHDAVTPDAEQSLHITLGLFPYVVRDLLQEAVQVAAEGQVEYRRSLPVSLDDSLSLSSLSAAELKTLLEQSLTDEIVNEAISRLNDETAIAGLQKCERLLAQPAYSDDATLTVEGSSLLNVERHEGKLKVRVIGQVLSFAEPMATAVEALVGQRSMQISSLPGLDKNQTTALVDCLLQADAATLVGQTG